MYITKKALPRRTFLRGMGAAIALPMLDAMTPALSAKSTSPPRLGFIYIENRVIQKSNGIRRPPDRGFELKPHAPAPRRTCAIQSRCSPDSRTNRPTTFGMTAPGIIRVLLLRLADRCPRV